MEELLQRLNHIGQSTVSSQSGSGATGTSPEKPSGHSVSTIVNLLSTLCRGSVTITHVSIFNVLRTPVEPIIKSLTFRIFFDVKITMDGLGLSLSVHRRQSSQLFTFFTISYLMRTFNSHNDNVTVLFSTLSIHTSPC